MANKSFTVQYLIKAREQYVAVAARVEKATGKMTAAILKSKKVMADYSRQMRNFGAGMTLAVTTPIVLASRAMINASGDAAEVSDKFRMVFAEIGEKGPAAAAALAEKYKLAASTSKEMLSTTGAILSATGLDAGRILEMSSAINGLSVDMASFHNFKGTAAESSMIFTKALLGEAESLKTNFGITILQNSAFQDAVKNKRMLTGATAQAAKAEVIYSEILRQGKSQKAIDNFNLTLKGYANQQRVAEEKNKQMMESFGQILLPLGLLIAKTKILAFSFLSNLSPAGKNAVLVLGGLLAVMGPLLLIFGSVGLALPLITAGMAALGVTTALTVSPILLIIAAVALLAAGALLIMNNWGPIKEFFIGVFDAVVESAKNAANSVLNVFINAFSGVLEFYKQIWNVISNFDFGAFDMDAIKAEFTGKNTVVNKNSVDVNMNVGLADGLEQKSPATIGNRRRDLRANVGSNTVMP